MELASKFRGLIVLVAVLLSVFLAVKSWQAIDDISKLDLQTPAISVTGEGKVFAKPDIGEVALAVLSEAGTVEASQKRATEVINKIFQTLKEKGVEEKDIKTANYSINPQYDYSDGKQRLRGYQVSQSLKVEIRDLAKTGEIISGASQAGANQVGGLSFTTEDPAALQAQARNKAIEDARKKAAELAAKLGVRLGKVIGFSEFSNQPGPVPYFGYEKAGMGGAAPPPQIPAGENEITVNVNITYQIK